MTDNKERNKMPGSFIFYISLVVIAALFFYGQSIEGGKSELKKIQQRIFSADSLISVYNKKNEVNDRSLLDQRRAIDSLNTVLYLTSLQVDSLKRLVDDQSVFIRALKDSVVLLKTANQSIVYSKSQSVSNAHSYHRSKYSDEHNCAITIVSAYRGRVGVKVWLDGKYVGVLKRSSVAVNNRGYYKGIKKSLVAGRHIIHAETDYGTMWDYYVDVRPGQSLVFTLPNK